MPGKPRPFGFGLGFGFGLAFLFGLVVAIRPYLFGAFFFLAAFFFFLGGQAPGRNVGFGPP